MIITTQDYGQFLINGVNNYTGTYFSKIVEGLEHGSVQRYINGAKLSSKVIWERVSEDIIYSEAMDICCLMTQFQTKVEARKQNQQDGNILEQNMIQ